MVFPVVVAPETKTPYVALFAIVLPAAAIVPPISVLIVPPTS